MVNKTGAETGFFLGGMHLSGTNFKRNTKKKASSRAGGGRVRTPCTLPLDLPYKIDNSNTTPIGPLVLSLTPPSISCNYLPLYERMGGSLNVALSTGGFFTRYNFAIRIFGCS